MEGFIAEVRLFGGNFAPRDWGLCQGQLMQITQNTALFSLIGTTFGGDGRTTMQLPDLRGRAPIHPGNGPGLTNRLLGQRGGSETNTLNITQLPGHSHAAAGTLKVADTEGTVDSPVGGYPAKSVIPASGRGASTTPIQAYTAAADSTMAADAVTVTVQETGGGQPINNMQPWLAMNYIIALQGIFPSRS